MIQTIDLNGSWTLRWTDGQRGDRLPRALGEHWDALPAIPAQVPGEVHLDLVRAGLLAEPAVGLNCLAARWVEETIWYYRRTFHAPALAAGQHAWLVFGCLDLAATVYLNGQKVGQHANAFTPCRLEVTGALQPGENTLVIEIEAGLFATADRPGKGYGMGPDSELAKRNWLRKTQSSFGWDWATRLLNVGIYGDVALEIASTARFDRLVVLAEVSPDLQQGTVTGRVFVDNLLDRALRGTLTVEIEGTGRQASAEVEIRPGPDRVQARVTLPEPELWWPVGHGAQPLYTVRATLVVEGEAVGSETRRVGFRRVRVNQDPHPAGGRYFVIEINNQPVFVKGANFVPADMILARIDRDRYSTLIDRALEANFNLLRIWGGGLYEADAFYELCDERGVLVWQEFIFACAKYPGTDEGFLASVSREATHQVRRLAHHPSLVVWCGNNEMEWQWGGSYEVEAYLPPSEGAQGIQSPDYAIFHLVLPVLLKREDGTRYYQPSSPFSPDHAAPNRDDLGDQHPWSVGFGDTDFRKYRQMSCRFPNEGGILGPTALPTVRACLPPGHEQPHSFTWEHHDNSVCAWGETVYPDDMLVQWLGRPVQSLSLEEYVYWGGVVQGEGLSEYIRNFRRRMFDTASAIFWMYNDCWPAVRSWTIVDYYLRRTPAFHPVRRANQPLTVALAVEGEQVRVYGVNEGPAWQGELRYGLFALAGGYPLDQQCAVELPGNASTLLAEFPYAEWQRLGERAHAALALLSRAGQEAARDRLFMPYFKEMQWPRAQVAVRREGGKAIFTSDTFAWRVCLDLDGEKRLPDNFFDVYPGIPTVLDWPAALGEPVILRVGNA
jgi:beta-mannosidase